MKNIYFLLLACILSINPVSAQDLSYFLTIDQENYNDLSNPTELTEVPWDDPELLIPIGFDFELFGDETDSLFLSGLGGLVLPLADPYAGPLDMIWVYGSDIIDRGYDTNQSLSTISHKTEGNPGNRICKVEWKNVGFYNEWDAGQPMNSFTNFQLWLYEGSNTIEIRFGESNVPNPNNVHDFNGTSILGFYENINFNTYQLDYLWYLSGPENNPEIEFIQDIYNYNIFGFNSEPADGRIYRFTVDQPVSAQEPGLGESIRIYPTLVDQYLQVETDLDNTSRGAISIVNELGQLLYQEALTTGTQHLDLSALPSGNYFVNIQADGRQHSQMVVKK